MMEDEANKVFLQTKADVLYSLITTVICVVMCNLLLELSILIAKL